MVGRGELTDTAWQQIAPLPPTSGWGGQWADHRRVINGTLWKLRTGDPLAGSAPPRYRPGQACSERFVRWHRDGT